jgi:hypothetical protein
VGLSVWWAAAALWLAACGTGGSTARATLRDSAGITLVENTTPDDSAAYDWWRLGETMLDIGGEAAGPGQDLYRVSGALRLGDGRVVVANGGTPELRFFDAAGNLLSTAGRRGEGPGEFQAIGWLSAGAADTLFVFDHRAFRMTLLGPDGAFLRDFVVGGAATAAVPFGRFADGAWAARLFLTLTPNEIAQGLHRPDLVAVRLDGQGNVTDTIGRFPGVERWIRVAGAGGQITSVEVVTPLFGRTPYHAVADGDQLIVANQDEPELQVRGPDGALRRIIRTGRAREPITDAHRNALIEKRLAGTPEAERTARRTALAALPAEGTVPPYGALLLDRGGNLWLADWDDGLGPAGRWTVYSADGRGVARIALPERFTPYDIGDDWILGRELDALDIEHVRLCRLARN